jgi:hypothetical protein
VAFKPGYLGYFNLDNAGGSPTNLSGYTDDASLPQTRSTLDVSVFGGGAVKQVITGLSGGDTIAIKGPYDVTLHSHLGSCLAAQDAGTASFSFIWGPGGSVSGQAKISGEALIANYTLSGSVGGRAEWTASLQVTGAVTNSTF